MPRLIAVSCLLLIGGSFLSGPGGLTAAPRVSQEADEPQVVVLSNLNVLRGRVTLTELGLRLETDSGSRLDLAHRQIWALAATLDEAYLAIAPRMKLEEEAELRRLFRWCLHHQLLDRAAALLTTAQTEARSPALVTALQLELDQARTANRSLAPTTLARDVGSAPAAAKTLQSNAYSTAQEFEKQVDRSLAELPKNAERFFTRELQPKLIHSCATADCHHAAREGLALWHDGAGHVGIRGYSRRNLFQVLHWIDRDRPAASELLARVRTAHGTPPSEVWDAASPTYQLLEYWVYAVSRDPGSYYHDVVLPSLAAQLQAPAVATSASPETTPTEPQPEIATVGFDEIPSPVPPEKLLEPTSPPPAVPLVPCDPLPFNRKYHPERREH